MIGSFKKLLTIVLAFLTTTTTNVATVVAVAWLACRRITRHAQGHSNAVAAIVQHVVLPLVGEKKQPEWKEVEENEVERPSNAG